MKYGSWIAGIVVLTCWTAFPLQLEGRHIIGGNITYECLGGGDYEFTMKVYRDCNCTGCAQLDNEAQIAIYRCTGVGCNIQTQGSFYAAFDVPISSIRNVDAPDYPCLIPPDVCVEEGVYRFRLSSYSVSLPLSTDSYHISYQRCCRNITISNIINPDDFGATYTVEITPEAQQLCNSSPVFREFPPTVICADAALNFDHSAVDPDGDQLVYEFCPPLDGGGPITDQLLFGTCEGAYPNPACPPPYGTVFFRAPTYTPEQPMGGDPVIRINPNTGLITGTPRVQGQFVVGVCVSEYRNGVLIGQTYRDFQFNVASCDPQVVADVREDLKIGDKEFQINSCGNAEITFINESFQERFIEQFEWSFNINNQIQTFDAWNPTVTFPDVGEYRGVLILNPGTDCGDTAQIYVNIYPDITSDFSYEYDTCVAGPVAFQDLSESGSGFITSREWNFGDGSLARGPTVSHLYRDPGVIPVTLTVRDTNKCLASTTRDLPYFPVPNLIVVSPSTFDGCAPADIFFNNLSFPIDSTYDILWNFGDGGTSDVISPTHRYEEAGVYTVDLSIVSPIGCLTDTVFEDLIRVRPSPVAGFSYNPTVLTNLDSRVSFQDESQGGIGWYWDFGTGETAIGRNPTYTFPDTGVYEVIQVVTHASGCRDTLVQYLDVRPEVRLFMPTAFTPNSDARNDVYKGVGIMKGARNFRMTIWNRWGGKVFETTDPDQGWDGRIMNSGKQAPGGVYVVLVTFEGPRGEKFEKKTYATLVR